MRKFSVSGGQKERMNKKIDNVEAAQRKENFIKYHDYALKMFFVANRSIYRSKYKAKNNSTD